MAVQFRIAYIVNADLESSQSMKELRVGARPPFSFVKAKRSRLMSKHQTIPASLTMKLSQYSEFRVRFVIYGQPKGELEQ